MYVYPCIQESKKILSGLSYYPGLYIHRLVYNLSYGINPLESTTPMVIVLYINKYVSFALILCPRQLIFLLYLQHLLNFYLILVSIKQYGFTFLISSINYDSNTFSLSINVIDISFRIPTHTIFLSESSSDNIASYKCFLFTSWQIKNNLISQNLMERISHCGSRTDINLDKTTRMRIDRVKETKVEGRHDLT